MKIKDKIKEIININEKEVDKLMGLNSFGTMLNIMDELISELKDEEIEIKFNALLKLVLDKREEILNTELTEKNKNAN